ncbi:MAG: sigma-70 family RNA polymerase sigma factor [Phycisphaerae bacterium]|nr:sigma-70 family RNA polymerase sigma factor [Phycisphaerae bacterium]NIP53853.1 sigma-70 family RNA polymerase sigma factor [Phycisphaerae bacterium]NIS52802.1 sigma-70 family RNA polymerase sigma factor [Phycisphaerae bacterium]NIU10214.1 sigma-70 family RNA polymerase sigma factor [Phycisphaerae bacterium]NIU57972.1 sigma-70 family RNA polymerase sigma factor [Phycisphaerae bacterium]
MNESIDYVGLVQKAQLGDKECLNRLAEAVRERLYAYVYRYTLADDLTGDIVQESILKMLEALGELREADQFWPWLNKIALNKIRHHHRQEQQHRKIHDPDMNNSNKHKDSQEVIAGIVYEEFKGTVFAAMRNLKPEHRSVINMRCYDRMQYSEIAKVMGCSEFAAQKLFLRAKKSLKRQLARHGFGKGSLLMALVLFGKLTAESETAAAGVSVTSATIKVGAAASVAAVAASKTAILTLTTAGALTVGTIVATSGPKSGSVASGDNPTANSYVLPEAVQTEKGSREYWYYYPSQANNMVMMRVQEADEEGKHQYCQYLQNAEGNYYFESQKNTVYIENYRQWQKDFSVWRLPTDSFQLSQFLTQIDGRKRLTEDVYRSQSGLLLVVRQPGKDNSDRLQVTRHYNVLGEDYFKYDWPTNVKVVDNRDLMHKRGWTYFKITGKINGKEVLGGGRVPFLYAASRRYWPWVELKVGGKTVSEVSFAGLGRPWMGLHTIDTVRRDAAEKQIRFETRYDKNAGKAQVILKPEDGQILYTIDMEKDFVDSITFSGDTGGQIKFDYLQDIDRAGSEFAEPRREARLIEKSKGISWLLELMRNN